MYGKSYDGVTGLIGVDKAAAGARGGRLPGAGLRPLPLPLRRRDAARQRVPHPRALRPDRRHPGPDRSTTRATTSTALNDTQRPGCLAANYADQAANDDHDSAYWKARNLIPGATGSDVPLFLTQGLTENNTVADGTAQYLQNHTGYERAWLGPWEHVRGNETDESGRLKMGRAGWFDEVMRFYDQFLKGVDARRSPTRRSRSRPTTASGAPSRAGRRPTRTAFTTPLRSGTYTDDGTANATGDGAETGVWTISPPLAHAVHLVGLRRAPRSTSRRRCPTPTSCSTSTTSTRAAPAR